MEWLFWKGFIAGGVIGAFAGLFAAGLCLMGKDRTIEVEVDARPMSMAKDAEESMLRSVFT